MKIQLLPDEQVLKEGAANHFMGPEAVGGRLYLTNARLAFASHALNIQAHEASYPLSSIVAVHPRSTLGVVSNGMTVVLDNGREERFVVNGRQQWMAAIEHARGGNVQPLPPNREPATGQAAAASPTEGYAALPTDVASAATTSLWLEILLGLFALLGMGHVFSGQIALGIALLVGWWVFLGLAAAITAATGGLCACLFGPLYIAVPVISGIQASNHVKKTGARGSWKSLGAVAGAGCLLIVIAGIALVIFSTVILGAPLLSTIFQAD